MSKPLCVIALALGVAIGGAGRNGLGFSASELGPQETTPASSGASAADSELQVEIQNSLDKQPSLTGARVRATVTEQQIELSGSVARSRDKLTAARIALSYAANKKLANRITVTGGDTSASSPPGQSSKRQGGESPAPGKSPRPPLP